MLSRLVISNVALIERAELEFSEGLNILSGETGAGKSVILDSIDFALGAKADKSMIRYGAAECSVRAEFTDVSERVKAELRELDIEAEDALVISRRLASDGKGGIKLNGNPVTAAMLRRVTSLLVDVHGQSEHFFLLKESNQLSLLDRVAGEPVRAAKERLGVLLGERRSILSELAVFGGDEGERGRRIDVLRYQIEEIDRAELKEGEEAELTVLREKYRNAEKILGALGAAGEALSSDGGAIDGLNGAHRALASLRFPEYATLSERLENALAEISDISATVEEYAGELDLDEREAERVETRLDEIRTIGKKYGGSVGAALAFRERANAEYELLRAGGERMEQLARALDKKNAEIYAVCEELTEARKRAAKDFETRVTAELVTLNIASARFLTQFDPYAREDVSSAGADGLDRVRFLFSANAGEPPKELGKIISGGEMSRFMLAVKAQLASVNEIGTYIFDEIDAGVGGRTAQVVAEKFARIARGTQIIAVSHLARIAAFADRQFYIEKREEGDRTTTRIYEVAGEDRLGELVRLVGGGGEFARGHARELLEEAEEFKRSLA